MSRGDVKIWITEHKRVEKIWKALDISWDDAKVVYRDIIWECDGEENVTDELVEEALKIILRGKRMKSGGSC